MCFCRKDLYFPPLKAIYGIYTKDCFYCNMAWPEKQANLFQRHEIYKFFMS